LTAPKPKYTGAIRDFIFDCVGWIDTIYIQYVYLGKKINGGAGRGRGGEGKI
jgi:hypothetical protein